MKRRDFIRYNAGSLGGACISTGNITASYGKDKNPDDPAVLFLFLSGGATHIETFNPIPTAPPERRGTTGAIDTNVEGIQIGGLFKELAKRTDKIAIARGFGHRDANHASATHWVVTGEANFGAGTTSKWPSYGSMMSKYHGTNTPNGLPTYVKIGSFQHDAAAWLGGKYTGYDATREGRKDLRLLSGDARFKNRLRVLDIVDGGYKPGVQIVEDWGELKGQAVEIIMGDASEAFRVEEDPDYNEFKGSSFGTDALTAIRLIQAGSKFVTLNLGGWDMHNNIVPALNSRQVELDTYLAKIMDAIQARGMYKNVMLVVTSEFGRTPKVNANAGRDHFGRIAPLMISCGQYEMGRVIGKTNSYADVVEEGECTPEDLAWTVYNHLGMKRGTRYVALDGRPHEMVKKDAKNILTEVV
jgi:hypothetical protein